MAQGLNYNILANGVVEFNNIPLEIDEDVKTIKLRENRVLSSESQINNRLAKVQSLVLRCLVSYTDIYPESVHTLQWQEKYQLLSVGAGTKIENLNFNASRMLEGKDIDYLPFSRKIISLGFINDSYVGGDLIFNHLDLTYKPKPDTILMLPADYMYSFSIRPVVSGEMLSLFTAFHGGKDILEELYEEKKGEEYVPLSYMR